MAQTPDSQGDGAGLKYLGFFSKATEKVVSKLNGIYQYGKENAGPLRQGVDTVEGSVKVLVGPVYCKIEHKPYEFLAFADRKVDETVRKINKCVPKQLKSVTCQAYQIAKKAPEVARSFVSGVKEEGVVNKTKEVARDVYAKTEPRAKGLYNKYEPVAEHLSLLAWYKLIQLPVVPQVIEALLPPSVYCAQMYNSGVQKMAHSHYKVATYLPVIPVEKVRNNIYRSLKTKDDTNESEVIHSHEDRSSDSDSSSSE